MRAIYRQLGLGDFAAREPALREHLARVERYAGHAFADDPDLRAKIDEHLGFAFTALGYSALQRASSFNAKGA